jgi:hypothetical protein
MVTTSCLSSQKNLEPADLPLPELPNTLLSARLTAGLELTHVLGELLDHRQVLGEEGQTSIRWFTDVRGCSRTAGDQGGIDGVILGMLQDELGVSTHLRRLKDDNYKAVRPQRRDRRLLVAAARLYTDAFDLALPQPGGQVPMAFRAVVDLQPLGAAIECYVKLVFAGIDAGAYRVMIAHLPRPFLVMRTLGSFNHPGPMKSRSRSRSAAALAAREHPIRRPAARPRRPPGPGHSSRNGCTIAIRANTRSAQARWCR